MARFIQELKLLRVHSIDFDADVPRDVGSEHGREKRYIRTTGSQWRKRRSGRQSWKRPGSLSSKTDQGTGADRNKSATLDSFDRGRRKSEGSPLEQANREVVRQGMLHKTTRSKITSELRRGQHEHRQHRRFQLTEHSLEYSQVLQRVKVRKQFPLTSIVDIVYNKDQNPLAFKLIFQKTEMLLEASDEGDCILWVNAIKKEWEKWNVKPLHNPIDETTELEENTAVIGDAGVRGSYLEENEGYFRTGKDVPTPTPGLSPREVFPKELLPSEIREEAPQAVRKYLRRETDIPAQELKQNPTQGRIAGRFGLAPRLQRSHWDAFQQKLEKNNDDDFAPLHRSDFIMIKYPRKGRSIPHERVFTMDFENLMLMWRRTAYSKFHHSHMLLTEQIVEVREGQNSEGFIRYPYEEVNDQSFSVLVEGVKRAGPISRKNDYAVLKSLDLICDSPQEQQLWCRAPKSFGCGESKDKSFLVNIFDVAKFLCTCDAAKNAWKLKSFISPKRHLFSSRYEFTDPTILWLKSHWILLAEGGSEIKEDAAFSFGKSLVPAMSNETLQSHLDSAHQFQLRESIHHGSSLHWDGFILFYNLLCGIDQPDCPLQEVFTTYAKDYPRLGMTVEEFQQFLIEHQEWSSADAADLKCDRIMRRYDYHHRAFKMYIAKGKPMEFHISIRLFSFAGFLSFLRSVDNSVIDREHEDVYQDMTQPLSHYFINSSHNTYLEGHQLTGLSTTDAYVRALLQGCRCLELDCWDGPNGEPKITHGNTFVSDLLLEEVVQTIDEYAFHTSNYPLILSLENHCCEAQQVRMAQIFQDVFGRKLVKENLVDKEGLDRLPSPHQLQGMIILKGTEKEKKDKKLLSTVIRQISKQTIPQSTTPQSPKKTTVTCMPTAPSKRKHSDLAASTENVFVYPTTFQREVNEDEEEKPEYEQEELHEDLNKLIVYCRSKHIRPWDWKEQQNTSVCNMFSFSESTALSRCKDTTEMLACSERQMVRTYPSGIRTDSSNYPATPLWNHGIQMVALNVQTPGLSMYLNQGKFRQNGGCGYILKPKVMRDPDEKEFTPFMKSSHHAVTPVNLEITLLSGQNLQIPSKKTLNMEILYQTYGIPYDCERKKYNISSVDTNPLWPQFEHTPQLDKKILMPELCLVLFAVYIRVRRKLLAGTKQVLLGQNVFPLTSLKPGLKFIPLRTPGGESTSHIGVFVKIEITKLISSNKCPEDLDPSMHTFVPTSLPETCHQYSESLEDMTTIDYNEEEDDHETTHHSQSNNSSNGGHVLSRGPPQFFRQGAINEFTVEVHAENNTQDVETQDIENNPTIM